MAAKWYHHKTRRAVVVEEIRHVTGKNCFWATAKAPCLAHDEAGTLLAHVQKKLGRG
jgi:hypothetical protein